MSGKISFTISPARAGKSTFVRKWLKETDPDGLNRVSLCRDDFRIAVYGERFCARREPEMHNIFDAAVRALHNTSLYRIILDETNCSVKSIRSVFRLDIDAKPYFINTPIDICLERAYATNQPDLAEGGVITRMFDNLVKLCNYGCPGFAQINEYNEITEELIYQAVEDIREEVRNGC